MHALSILVNVHNRTDTTVTGSTFAQCTTTCEVLLPTQAQLTGLQLVSINGPALNCNFRPRHLDAFRSSSSNNTCRFSCTQRASIVQAVYITETKRMPRCYQHRSSQKNKWSNDQLQAALKAVQEGELKPHRAAVQYGIPPSTLYDHLKGKSKKRYGGPPTVLTCAEEKEIATACEVLQQFGYPLTTNLVGAIVRDYVTAAERPTLFRNSIPGYDWWQGFLQRWPQLSQRKPEHLPRHRAEGACPEARELSVKRMQDSINATTTFLCFA